MFDTLMKYDAKKKSTNKTKSTAIWLGFMPDFYSTILKVGI